ncbi:MAG: ABC transporter ATP-binding protein [Rhodocyclaceae bacterium]|nr:ABC transporter ATP-binding protein [Rhodocyclaceae bacterium]MBX3669582.1 ABC transporter ATP-binding protein [Rhodocyclaceae bacterium]
MDDQIATLTPDLPAAGHLPLISARGVCHAYGAFPVLRELRLEVAPGEFLAVVGPSGCGKSTLLSLMAGTRQPGSGSLLRRAATRMVYQQDGLFPWLTTAENIALGLDPQAGPAARARCLDEMLELVRLADFRHHYPHQLSGGMRRRVELARVLAGPADLLLMDEPFSALDYQTRRRMHRELQSMLASYPRAVVLVTHDIEEAALLADRILLLSDRPATVRSEFHLPAGRSRAIGDREVLEVVARIHAELAL